MNTLQFSLKAIFNYGTINRSMLQKVCYIVVSDIEHPHRTNESTYKTHFRIMTNFTNHAKLPL